VIRWDASRFGLKRGSYAFGVVQEEEFDSAGLWVNVVWFCDTKLAWDDAAKEVELERQEVK
jgi:hypothetical protein